MHRLDRLTWQNERRRLTFEVLESRELLSVQSWDMAADFAANFAPIPQSNPNGPWTYVGADGKSTSLVVSGATGYGLGYVDPGGIPTYARGGVNGTPAGTVTGHGPNRIIWTAPPDADLGGVELTGILTQGPSDPARQVQLRIYKNESPLPLATIDANFTNKQAIVSMAPKRIAISPGDWLSVTIDGVGPQGNTIPTFASWNIHIAEFESADFNRDRLVSFGDLPFWVENFGLHDNALPTQGDADGSNRVDGLDFLIWQQQIGNSINSGIPLYQYRPAAVVVQTAGVTLPDGSWLSIAGSQTHGLQEAVNYAAANGWDVFVLPGTYSLNAHLDFPALQVRTFRLENATLNFSNAVTDYGIRFDSTMMVDWYWRGGALNAANATEGVLFQPRTPHPLDGITHGTIGVGDSRFEFQVNISARVRDVRMDTRQAGINDVAFYFQDTVSYVGNGFSSTNVFGTRRLDDPIPFDIYNPAGRVTILPPIGTSTVASLATIVKPDGSTLDVTETTTSGLQEAYDYAYANSLDVLLFGRGVQNSQPFVNRGHFLLGSTLTINPLFNRTFKQYSATFAYNLSSTAMSMSEVVNSDFEFTGQVVPPNANVGVHIRPVVAGVSGSIIRIEHSGGGPTSTTSIFIDPSVRTIENSSFYFHEILGGYFNITIANPSATTFFRNNFLRTIHNHDYTHVAVQVGQGITNADRISNNSFVIRTNTDGGPSHLGLQVWGAYNQLDFQAHGPGLAIGIKFEPGSKFNSLKYGSVQATTVLADFGANNIYMSQAAATASANLVDLNALETSSAADSAEFADNSALMVASAPLEYRRRRATANCLALALESLGAPTEGSMESDFRSWQLLRNW